MGAFDALLSPFQIKHLRLRNRVVSSSHAPGYAENGLPGLRYQLYHEEKARGGLALTMFGGSSNVARDSGSIYGQIFVGSDEVIALLRESVPGPGPDRFLAPELAAAEMLVTRLRLS